MLRSAVIILVCACMLTQSHAQIKIVPRDRLEAMANPRLSPDSAYLSFDTRHIHAGTIKETDMPLRYVYRMSNNGTSALPVKRIVSTCSCARAVCDRTVIAPGDTARITVTYDPKGHPGKFERRIFVYTQEGSTPSAVLKLSVTVDDGCDFSGLYRYPKGNIRLRRDTVEFEAGKKSVEKIPFVNLSGSELRLGCDRMLLPGCLDIHTVPQVLKDREEGEIVISFDPDAGAARERMLVVLKGTGAVPSASSITVKVK